MVKPKIEDIEKTGTTESKPVGLVQGAYDNVELVPTLSKRELKFDEMVETIKGGKFFVLHAGTPQNSLYPMIRKLKEKANLDVVWSKIKAPDGTFQFALFLKKEKKD